MKKINQIGRQLLVDNNIPVTEPRLLLLEILLKNEGPLKIQEVIKFSKGKLAVSSLYRIINDLKDLNLINEFKTLENTKVIELVSLEDDHHHHIFCESCGAVYDFEFTNNLEKKIDQEIKNVELEMNISITSHSLELHGLCNNC
jgi:Fe2+ or Zn2+ uptake regulation protein